MDLSFWALFALTVFTASMVPGPSTLIAFTHGARYGWKQVLATALGNMSASVVQAILACAGLGIVLAKSAVLFMFIKYAGAAYLVYLGFSMWRSASNGLDIGGDKRSEADTTGRLYRSGFWSPLQTPRLLCFSRLCFPSFLTHREQLSLS